MLHARTILVLLFLLGLAITLHAEDAPPKTLPELKSAADSDEGAGKFDASFPLREKILELTRKEKGEDSLLTAEAYYLLANNYRQRNKLKEAESPARKALEVRLKEVGERDPSTIGSYAQVVDILNHSAKYQDAEVLARKLLVLRQDVLGVDHVETANARMMLGGALFFLKKNDEAAPLFQRAFEIHLKEYGPDHAITKRTAQSFADNLNGSLGNVYTAAQKKYPNDPITAQYVTFEHMLEVMKTCFPESRYPDGHRRMARTMLQLGDLRNMQGRRAESRTWYEKALAIQDKIIGKEFPNGHQEWAQTHTRLARTLHTHGEYEEAGKHAQKAVAMYRHLYNAQEFPNGHPDLAAALVDSAFMKGGGIEGRKLYEEALEMQKKQYPDGHRDVVATLMNLGNVLIGLGDARGAAQRLTEALEMSRKVDKEPTYEQASTLQYIGRLHKRLGDAEEAEKYLTEAVLACVELYPKHLYPLGHDHLATTRKELALALYDHGKGPEAAVEADRSEKMQFDLAAAHMPDVSEAEALNFAVLHLSTPDLLISTWISCGRSDDELYEHLWRRRGLIHRVHTLRQQAALKSSSPEVKQLVARYQESRQKLAQAAFAPAASTVQERTTAGERLAALTKSKESLERELASSLPELRRLAAEATPPDHRQLGAKLPPHAVFIDLVQFYYFPPGKPQQVRRKTPLNNLSKDTVCYAAFLLSSNGKVTWIDLGPAEPIDKLVKRWREEIVGDAAGERVTAAELGKLLWSPLANNLPQGVNTVFIGPDGALSAVPWCALPGTKPGSILLEDLAIATVPHGQFLLAELSGAKSPVATAGRVLSVGDVDFRLATGGKAVPNSPRSKSDGLWPELPGTRQELSDLAAIGGERVTALRGREATSSHVLAELPKVRFAHLATHGFFADPELQSILQVDEKAFVARSGRVPIRSSVAARNPLLLSGLVFAGGEAKAGVPAADDGLLTAEAIAALPLADLQLAVLSACETGLGDVAGGEGVFGLQRAFHQAGTKNVVASLWKVNDEPTAALMRLFYRNLWEQNLPPLEALRQAQLALYRHPEQVTALASATRGPNFNKVVKLVEGGAVEPTAPRSSPRRWAAFVLSGTGQ